MDRLEKIFYGLIAIGIALIGIIFLFPNADTSIVLTVYAIAAFLFFPTYGFKKLFGLETFYIITLFKTKKLTVFIETISKPDWWDLLADIGIILGFGTIAVDYLIGRKLGGWKRIVVAIVSTICLFGISFLTLSSFIAADSPVILPFSIGFGFGGLMLFTIVSLVWQIFDIVSKILIGKVPCPGIIPIIPGVQMPNVPPILTPPVYIWGAFLIIVVVHEFAHGALMKRAKVKIKSTGLLLLGLLPMGAFVEPDEKQLNSKSERQKLRVYAIGPAANFYSLIVFGIIFLLAFQIANPVIVPMMDAAEKEALLESVTVTKVLEEYELCGTTFESPANGQIEAGWILKSYNGIDLNTLFNLKEALSMESDIVPLVFETGEGEIIEKAIAKNKMGQIGFETRMSYIEGREPSQKYVDMISWISIISIFFGWLLLLNFALAVVNFLPTDPLDGGKMAKMIFLPYFGFMKMNKKDTEKLIGRLMLWIIVILFLLNAFPLLL